MPNVLVNDSSLTAIGNAIRAKNGETTTYKPAEMAAAITAISGGSSSEIPLTNDDFVFSGMLSSFDSYGVLDNLIDKCKDIIQFNNVTNITNMFFMSKLAFIPQINLQPSALVDFSKAFYNTNYLISPPIIIGTGINSQNFDSIFENSHIETINDDFFNFFNKLLSGGYCHSIFANCQNLRNFPSSINKVIDGIISVYPSGNIYNNLCRNCFNIREINGIGIIDDSYSSNLFVNTISNTYMLKKFTFISGKTVNWKTQTISFETSGYYPTNRSADEDKRVTDDTTYNALKNTDDWWSNDINYSRYNHNSAVETINSLPDTSAYLASKGGTNTIKFKGEAGTKTDGGAINTLTDAEIAVATAKGWTVSFT